MNDDLTKQFAAIVTANGVTGDVVSPPDLGSLAAVAHLCHENEVAISLTCGAPSTHQNAPKGGIVISVHRLNDVTVAPAGLTVRAAAGATVAQLRDAVAAEKLAIVGLSAQTGSGHVGTLIARGDVPRRSLAGVEAVLTTGETVKAGGGMLKDVVGYDLLAALLGSAGHLAIVAAVTFRLEPAAARTATAKPPGARTWQPGLADAFDPKRLLRSGASR
ncbi:MAG: FAD-binding oxidoreductase [Candidatus Dormiibacterota bacterium]